MPHRPVPHLVRARSLPTATGRRRSVAEAARALRQQATWALNNPWRFLSGAWHSFHANRGLLLAGALAYYALLSIVPLLILTVMALSQWVGQEAVLGTVEHYLGWLLPGQSGPVVHELRQFLAHRGVLGWVLMGTMLFFSSLAFSVLDNALAAIFHHRRPAVARHRLVSLLMPYGFILCLGAGLALVTVVASALQALGTQEVRLFGQAWSLHGFSAVLLYLIGVSGELVALTAVYMVMPEGRLSLPYALVGALFATVLWELTRHLLVWYFATLSQIGTVYGSMTTAIAVLLSLEMAGILLLAGAQLIAEFERAGHAADAVA